jgi:superfamily II DNA/RNA helicase
MPHLHGECKLEKFCTMQLLSCNSTTKPAIRYLLASLQVNSSNPPPFDAPDVIVATPAGLVTLLTGPGSAYGRLWTEEGFQAWVKHVVLDEADLMLTQAFSKPVNKILQVQ